MRDGGVYDIGCAVGCGCLVELFCAHLNAVNRFECIESRTGLSDVSQPGLLLRTQRPECVGEYEADGTMKVGLLMTPKMECLWQKRLNQSSLV